MKQNIASGIVSRITEWVMFRPALARKILSAWAGERSAFRAADRHIVMSYPMADQLLSRNRQFHLADAMRDRIAVGEFLLNLEPPGLYDSDKQIILDAFYGSSPNLPSLLVEIREFCSAAAARLLAGKSSIDVVAGFLEVVSADVVLKYFLGKNRAASEDEIGHIRSLSKLIVASDPKDRALVLAAQDALKHLEGVLDEVYASYKQNPIPGDDAFTRMLHAGVDRKIAQRNVLGMATAGTATVSRAGGQALDSLLRQPQRVIRACQQAACAQDEKLVLKFIIEALRFNPLFPFVLRHAVEDTTIELDNGERYLFEAGSSIGVSLMNAMFDPCLLYTSPSPRDATLSRMPSSA